MFFVGVFLLTGILMPENSCIVGVCLTFKHTAAPQPGLAGSVTPNSGLFAFESQKSHALATEGCSLYMVGVGPQLVDVSHSVPISTFAKNLLSSES